MKLTELTWGIDVVNRKSYYLRYPVSDKEYFEATYGLNLDSYASDPNHQYSPSEEFIYLTEADVTEELNYSTGTFVDITRPYEGRYTAKYIPENTMYGSDYYVRHNNTTRLLVRSVFQPVVLSYNPIGDYEEYEDPGNDYYGHFFSYTYTGDNGVVYTIPVHPAPLAAYLTGYIGAPVIGGEFDWDVYTIGNVPGLLEVIEANRAALEGVSFIDCFEVWNNLDAGDLDGGNSTNNGKLTFHKNGVCWYTVPIRHMSDDEFPSPPEPNAYGKYGVVRNNIYRININSILSPGSATIPMSGDPIDPRFPINRSSAAHTAQTAGISTSIDIMPWRAKR